MAGVGDSVWVLALQRVVVAPGGVTMRLEAGQRYELPALDAAELARAGYVQIETGPIETGPIETAALDDAPGVEHAVTRKGRRK